MGILPIIMISIIVVVVDVDIIVVGNSSEIHDLSLFGSQRDHGVLFI